MSTKTSSIQTTSTQVSEATKTLEESPDKPSQKRLTQQTLLGADGVRAIGCLMVVFSHLFQRLSLPDQTPFVQNIQVFFMKGSFGVSVFFVLSGMLLSYPFWKRYLEGKPFPNIREYIRRRAARIMPGFYASLLVSFFVTLYFVKDSEYPWLRLFSGATFISAFHYITFFPVDLNGPLWSIGFEVVCYVLMPLAMLGLFALGKRKRPVSLAWIYWLIVIAVALLLNQLVITYFVPGSERRGWEYGIVGGAKFWMPRYNPIGFFSQYTLGIFAAGFIAWYQTHKRKASWLFDVVALLSFLGLIVLLWWKRLPPEHDMTFSWQGQPYFFPLSPGLVALLLATLPFSKVLGYIFDNPFARYTAKVSFGLYIWHYLLLELIRLLYDEKWSYFGIKNLWTHLTFSVSSLALAYLVATLSYYLIEKPFLRRKGSLEKQPSLS
jgi:peptidoglycan/LPS O-acetylase OafA/YrhL